MLRPVSHRMKLYVTRSVFTATSGVHRRKRTPAVISRCRSRGSTEIFPGHTTAVNHGWDASARRSARAAPLPARSRVTANGFGHVCLLKSGKTGAASRGAVAETLNSRR